MAIDPVSQPLLHFVAEGAKWLTCDFADEAERLLRFVKDAGALGRYLPRLRGPEPRRDEALAEIDVAAFLVNVCGFAIIAWEPEGANSKMGDLLVRPPGSRRVIFVEIKAPGWESTIPEEHREARTLRPKYLDEGETGGYDAPVPIRHAVRKAYPKFGWRVPTLLVICDDLHIPLNMTPDYVVEALYQPAVTFPGTRLRAAGSLAEDGPFVGHQYERLGAVATLNRDAFNKTGYTFNLFPNPHALLTTALPRGAFRGFATYNVKPGALSTRTVHTIRTAITERVRWWFKQALAQR